MMIPVEKETLDKIVTLIEKRRTESQKVASEKLASVQAEKALIAETAKELHACGLTNDREKTAQELTEPNGAFKLLRRLAVWRQKYASVNPTTQTKVENKLGVATKAVEKKASASLKPNRGEAEQRFAEILGL